MFISEIFHSLQGEGVLLGVPSVFIRTSGCNLRCRWCDTPYASWHPEGEKMSLEAILEKVDSFECRHVVLTGGEPMIAPQLPALTDSLKKRGYHITIETAATVMPSEVTYDLGSLSPKLSNSTPDQERAGEWRERHEERRWNRDVIRAWIKTGEYQLKFVISSAEDVLEMEKLLQQVGEVPHDRVLLMPEGTDVETLRKRAPVIAQICRERGYRFAPRLQIELYGNKRGT